MADLQRLRPDHAAAVQSFETVNRAWFARSISDRGDEFFQRFDDGFEALLADQEAGRGAFHVLVAEDGSVLGRFNLEFVTDGVAVLGYRVARHAAGRGVATSTVRELCRIAPSTYGVHTIRAATSEANTASRTVLHRAGFVAIGPADPGDVGGRPGTWFQRDRLGE